MSKPLVTHERLLEVLDYNPTTGEMRWKVTVGKAKTGALAGFIERFHPIAGYRRINIDTRHYMAHRLAWFYVHKAWPENDIDHINRERADNRIENLRQATRNQNNLNSKKPITNKSGYKGVSWDKLAKKWTARIGVNGRQLYLGLFDTKEEAHAAYCAAARKYYGEFARVK